MERLSSEAHPARSGGNASVSCVHASADILLGASSGGGGTALGKSVRASTGVPNAPCPAALRAATAKEYSVPARSPLATRDVCVAATSNTSGSGTYGTSNSATSVLWALPPLTAPTRALLPLPPACLSSNQLRLLTPPPSSPP
eukprot:3956510-Pleurochrysis_carterae.AAC.1